MRVGVVRPRSYFIKPVASARFDRKDWGQLQWASGDLPGLAQRNDLVKE